MVDEIFLRLHAQLGDNPKRLREYLDMIEVLSENRDLKHQIMEVERTLTQIDVKKLPSYQLGMEQGLEDGLEKGLDQGKAWLLQRQLQLKFGALPPNWKRGSMPPLASRSCGGRSEISVPGALRRCSTDQRPGQKHPRHEQEVAARL